LLVGKYSLLYGNNSLFVNIIKYQKNAVKKH
jgi:hypothetical protein